MRCGEIVRRLLIKPHMRCGEIVLRTSRAGIDRLSLPLLGGGSTQGETTTLGRNKIDSESWRRPIDEPPNKPKQKLSKHAKARLLLCFVRSGGPSRSNFGSARRWRRRWRWRWGAARDRPPIEPDPRNPRRAPSESHVLLVRDNTHARSLAATTWTSVWIGSRFDRLIHPSKKARGGTARGDGPRCARLRPRLGVWLGTTTTRPTGQSLVREAAGHRWQRPYHVPPRGRHDYCFCHPGRGRSIDGSIDRGTRPRCIFLDSMLTD